MTLPEALEAAHLAHRGSPVPADVRDRWDRYAEFVSQELEPIAFEVDRRARPYLAHHDTLGGDPEEVVLNRAHRTALRKVYASGLATGPVEGRHPWWESFGLGYLTTDVGTFCSATVTMATAFSLAKFGTTELQERFLVPLLENGGDRQGATWATEAQGGSDLGANLTKARPAGPGRFELTGEKYFCSNVGASCAVVTARPDGAPAGPRGVRLFFVPARREKGGANWRVRRLKEKLGTTAVPTGEVSLAGSEAYLLGTDEEGILPTMEMLNVSRICNAVGSAGVLERGRALAVEHAGRREAFGKRLREHPLMAQDLAALTVETVAASLLAFDPAFAFDAVWRERPFRSEAAKRLRFSTHAAKLVTAEQAVRGTYAALEVFGGPGYLEEFPVAKLVRDAMVVPVWEGGANRQALDAQEILTRGHPEDLWRQEAERALDESTSEAVRAQLGRLLECTRGPPKQEEEAKVRLRSLGELREQTLLETWARRAPSGPSRARAEAISETFAALRPTTPPRGPSLEVALRTLATGA